MDNYTGWESYETSRPRPKWMSVQVPVAPSSDNCPETTCTLDPMSCIQCATGKNSNITENMDAQTKGNKVTGTVVIRAPRTHTDLLIKRNPSGSSSVNRGVSQYVAQTCCARRSTGAQNNVTKPPLSHQLKMT